MIINTAGDYTLRYTATDECENSSSVDRNLTVASPRTVLYTDGTFIINESPADRAANEALHGVATNEYEPMLSDGSNYNFSSSTFVFWDSVRSNVLSCEVGSEIHPISIRYWFATMINCERFLLGNLYTEKTTYLDGLFSDCRSATEIDISNFDTSSVNTLAYMFSDCGMLETIDLSNFNTENVTDFSSMFRGCSSLVELDLSSFDSRSANSSTSMFENCTTITTIYATQNFVLTNVASTRSTFVDNQNLVGGAGTSFAATHKTFGTYGRIDNPPDEPGYFTLKTT